VHKAKGLSNKTAGGEEIARQTSQILKQDKTESVILFDLFDHVTLSIISEFQELCSDCIKYLKMKMNYVKLQTSVNG
jgi:hypothetical protein